MLWIDCFYKPLFVCLFDHDKQPWIVRMQRAESSTERKSKIKEQPSIDEAIALIISGQSNSENATTLDTLTSAQLLAYTSDGLDPLTVLNPVTHSLPYLYFM